MGYVAPLSLVTRTREWARKPKIRFRLKVIALTAVLIGAVWSVVTLDLTWSQIQPGYLLLNLLALAPINLYLAALAFQINGQAIGHAIPLPQSLLTVSTANVAELLPLPGGALVRGAALVDAGASVADSTKIVVLASLLTLFISLTASLAALGVLSDPAWLWLATLSGLGFLTVLVLAARFVSPRDLSAMVAVRLVTLVLTVVRIIVAFATLGISISWIESTLYAIAPTLGATVAIIPAGFGLNEAIAAGLAALIASSAASAFLATALNRVLGLIVGAVFVISLPVISKARGK